eukprot:1596537-Pleurochrysis_carterae.AAC.1
MQDKPKQFLGMNIDMRKDGGVKISASAYAKAKAETYLPKPLADYPIYDTQSTPQLVKDYEIAARKEHHVERAFQKNYQSKVRALIYAHHAGDPASRSRSAYWRELSRSRRRRWTTTPTACSPT